MNEGLSKRSSRQDLGSRKGSQQSLQPISTKHRNSGFVLPTDENDNGGFNRKNSRYLNDSKTNSRMEVGS